MKCDNCGHASHPTGDCGVEGCGCAENKPVELSAVELRAMSADDMAVHLDAMRATLAVVEPAPETPDEVEPIEGGPGDSPTPAPGSVPPEEEGADAVPPGPRFRIPVGLIENLMTSDGRMLAAGSVAWRETPFPLMGIDKTTWDHQNAEIVGRVDEVGKDGETVWASGVMLGNERGLYYAGLIADRFIKGVSADLVDVREEVVVTAVDDEGFPSEVGSQMTQAVVAGFTICPFPAFEGAYIILEPEEGAAETPTPTLEKPTAEQAAAGLYVLQSDVRCGDCGPETAIVASAGPMRPPAAWFEDPGLDGPTRLTVEEDGRIYGHLAVFGTCHIGLAGKCITPFPSKTGYSQFNLFSTLTAEGDLVPTGVITMDTGHADVDERLSASAVRAHYDNTGLAAADVHMDHDEYGIWIAGATRPDVTELTVRKLRGSALSGDWRWIGAGMEVVAALSVNVPGFPVVRAVAASGHPMAMVAAGGLPLARIQAAELAGGLSAELEQRLAVLTKVVGLSLEGARETLRARMARLG